MMNEEQGTSNPNEPTPTTPAAPPPGLTFLENPAPVRPGKRDPNFIFPPEGSLPREFRAVLEGECQVLDDLTTRIGRFVREGRAIDRQSLNRAGTALQGILAVLARIDAGSG